MAQWDAHLLGSLCFTLLGLWWIILSIWYRLQSDAKMCKTKKKRCTSCMKCSETMQTTSHRTGCLKSWIPQPFYPCIPIEPVMKIILGSAGAIGESFLRLVMDPPRRLEWYHESIFDESGNFIQVDKFQHSSMYSIFIISGVVDLLILFIKLPHATSPLYFATAFLCQGLIFQFHSEGLGVLTTTYHKLQQLIIICCTVLAYLRTRYTRKFVINVLFGCSILLQGTWLFQSSFLVYKDGATTWQLHKTEQHSDKLEYMVPMYLATVFTWHLIAVATTVLLFWAIMYCVVNRRCISKKGNCHDEDNVIYEKLKETNDGNCNGNQTVIDVEN